MTNEFDVLNLRPELVQVVAELGYVQPTPIQSEVIPVMIAGQDVIGQAQTGTGKTAAFALPILHKLSPERGGIQALVLAPTRELALQVTSAMSEYGRECAVRVITVYGGQPYYRQISQLRKGVDIVVGTPGRVLDLLRQNALDLGSVNTVVLDEADEMLSMGFIEDIEAILEATPATRQTALFSATMPHPVRRLADRYLRQPQFIAIQSAQLTVESTEQRYYLVNEADKTAALTRLFEVEPITSALIFVRTRMASSELVGELAKRGFPAEVLNGDLAQEAREGVMNRFRNNQIKVLVATDVAARGLDVDDISHVFNFDLPEDEEIYIHRIGRTGRAGKSGIAISLITPREQFRLRKIEKLTRQKITRASLPSEEDILNYREGELIRQLTVWLQRSRYRRERELVAKLVEDGHDPLEVAAAALKIARADEKQRPIAPVNEVQETRPRSVERSERPTRSGWRRNDSTNGSRSHEAGMVRLTISRGREHGIRPNDVVSTIAYHADIPGNTIGKIHIHDQHTLVDIPEEHLAQVLAKAEKYRIHRQPVKVELA